MVKAKLLEVQAKWYSFYDYVYVSIKMVEKCIVENFFDIEHSYR
jgi:hypothetical protein